MRTDSLTPTLTARPLAPATLGARTNRPRHQTLFPVMRNPILEMSEMKTGHTIGRRIRFAGRSNPFRRRSGVVVGVVAGGRQEPRQAARRSQSPDPALGDGTSLACGARALIVVENAPVPEDRRVWHEAPVTATGGLGRNRARSRYGRGRSSPDRRDRSKASGFAASRCARRKGLGSATSASTAPQCGASGARFATWPEEQGL